MKRLKSILLKMEPNTTTYKELYEGGMLVVPNKGQPFDDYDNCYYFGDIGYKFESTNKLAQDKPTVTLNIPIDLLSFDVLTSPAAAGSFAR